MSKYKMILLRIQSAEGTKRLEVNLSDTTCELFEKVHALFGLNSFGFALYQERNHKGEIRSSRSRTLGSLGLKHGDMLYLAPVNGTVLFPQEQKAKNVTYTSESGASESTVRCPPGGSVGGGPIPEDEVDIQLWKHDGKIQRRRDDKLCRHNSNGCCVHCSPLEPFDEAYLREQNIKHLSFHAYLRKQTSGADRGKFLSLEDVSCRIRAGCKDHPPWPRGICSKCQPNAITLNRQPYRHVDNVAFENPQLVERFLDYWRVTGHQRVGLLYGRYGQHTDVPLGIRATVAAIYEPPQEGARDSLRLLPDEREPLVEALAKELGLRRVGWIFTDLVAEDVQLGTVKTVRGGSDSYFLSAQECIMAGHYQSQHPNPCRYASGSSGHFGSKFVTVCVTGDSSNQVHMEGYQVSNQCVALVRDGCLLPTKDAPELGYVRESTDKQYVPDVYYKEKDTYGNEVPRLARPLPVEYLLVDVPASTPLTPVFTFNTDPSKRPFPVENRLVDGHVQDFNALAMYMAQFPPSDFLTAVSDFHLLLYIATMDMLPMREHMSPLLAAVRAGDVAAAREWARSDHWATVEQLIAASGGGRMSPPPPVSSRPATGSSTASAVTPGQQRESASVASSTGSSWTCPFCTFLNSSDVTVCDMCRLPRSMTH